MKLSSMFGLLPVKVLLLLCYFPATIRSQSTCNITNDTCGYKNDGWCDDSNGVCDPFTDCVDCNQLQDYSYDCELCITNQGNYCQYQYLSTTGAFEVGVCVDPLTAAANPDSCTNRGGSIDGTSFVSDCNDLPSFAAITPPPTPAPVGSGAFACPAKEDYVTTETCPYDVDFYCDVTFALCSLGSDCFDCDPLSEFDNSCSDCIANGGVHCLREIDSSETTTELVGVCRSPELAEAFPTACLDTGGTEFSDTCPLPFSCSDPDRDFLFDSCGYTLDGTCDAGTSLCDEDTDCFDCDRLRKYDSSCQDCVANGGFHCRRRGNSRGGVCVSPELAQAFPTFCTGQNGTEFSSVCPLFSCEESNIFDDPCPFQSNGYCNAGDNCAEGTDCFDCDPYSEFNNLSCESCVGAGGAYCRMEFSALCSSPSIADAFPSYCEEIGGTGYVTECGEPEICDYENDPCPGAMDGWCGVGYEECPAVTSDCFDCSPCLALRFEGCEACTAAGCLWCGADSACMPADMPEIPSFVFNQELSCTPSDFVDACYGDPESPFAGAHTDLMDWVYEMINIKQLWALGEGYTGAGIGVRVNDDGVDETQENFIKNFDSESSCEVSTPIDLGNSFYSHGTACTALLAASQDNECMTGIAPDATISSCRILNQTGALDEKVMDEFRYLYENHERVDVSSNSYGTDACEVVGLSGRKLNEAVCPFVQEDAFTPCSKGSLCEEEEWGSGIISFSCQQAIMNYCTEPVNQEKDQQACLSYLDLFVRCEYNAQNEQERAAIIKGITEGRDGKGIIYVFAVSNSNALASGVETEGILNNRFTISVGAVGRDGIHASYSATGSPLFVTAPGGDLDHYGNFMPPVAGGGQCYDASVGTSYATPLVAGVVALILQASLDLTWRDVQGILATTSQKVDSDDPSWTTNGAGLHHSYRYGFGVVDAYAAVMAASTWRKYGKELQFLAESGPINVPIKDYPNDGAESTVSVSTDLEFEAESVVVYLDISHSSRGDLDVILVSPSGTESLLHPGYRPENTQVDERWKLMSVRHWHEDVNGEWKLRVIDKVELDVEACIDAPRGWSFLSESEYGVYPTDCTGISRDTDDGNCIAEGMGIPYDPLLGLDDPVFSDKNGIGPLNACCVCGGGISVASTPDLLRSWKLMIYGHEVIPTVPPTGSPVAAPTPSPTPAPIVVTNNFTTTVPSSGFGMKVIAVPGSFVIVLMVILFSGFGLLCG